MRRPQVHAVALVALALAHGVLTPQASASDTGPTLDFDRKLKSFINPGTNINSTNTTLMYIEATGDKDIIHNIWDFTYGTPSFFYAVTNLNTTLNVTWANDKPESFDFSDPPKYRFGLQINKIWEFNDVNDTAKFDPLKHEYQEFSTSDIVWERVSIIQEEGEALLAVMAKSIGVGKNKRDGIITIKIDLFPYTAYSFDLPHLIHSANSSLIDVFLENITLSHSYNKSRFAMELVFISTEKSEKNFEMRTRKGLDDEHTPGVFEVIEIVTPETMESSDGGFVQYRPVCYSHKHRDVSSSIGLQTSDLSNTTLKKDSLASEFFDNVENFVLVVENTTVSMGTPQDGFYKKSNYTLWAFTVGYGNPPIEGFSLFVILILSIGLGIPVLLITVGGLYVCIKRRMKPNNQPVRLVEE